MSDQNTILNPFLKWAGGKRWFVDAYPHILNHDYNSYYEPFLGGGSVFFYLRPENAHLSDVNVNLINAYAAIKDDYKKVVRRLRHHEKKHSEEHYYKVRDGSRAGPHSLAGDFIYLNRTCWNGLYRVNKRGRFNVPIGDRTSIIRENDQFSRIAQTLQTAKLNVECFSNVVPKVGNGDFCFIDPPYTVKHDHNGFIKYNENLFTWEHQVYLRDLVLELKKRGGTALILNANHDSIKELYKGVGQIIPLSRSSMLAASVKHRGKTKEIAIRVGY